MLAEQFVEPTLVNAEHFEVEPGAILSHEPEPEKTGTEILADQPDETLMYSDEADATGETDLMDTTSNPEDQHEFNQGTDDKRESDVRE